MKRSLVLFSLALGGVASSQTLQWSTKYTITEASPTSFRKVVRADATHFWVAGNVGTDVVVARVDQFGNVVGSVQYDSPILGTDSVVEMQTQTDGSLVMLVGSRNQVTNVQESAYVLKYSVGLVKQWEFVMPGSGVCDSLALAALPNGTAIYASIRRGADLFATLFRLNGSGAQTNSASVNFNTINGQVRSIAPNAFTGGCVVMGQTGTRELLNFFSSGLVATVRNGPAPDNAVNAIFKGYVTDGGVFYGTGRYNTGSTQAAFYISDSTALNRVNIATGHTGVDIEAAPGNLAYAVASSTVANEHVVARLNTATNISTTIYSAAGTPLPTFFGVDPSGARFYTFAANQLRARLTTDGSLAFNDNFPSGQSILEMAGRNPQGIIAVGLDTASDSGLIQISDTLAGSRSLYRHIGGQPYTVVGSDTDSLGATVAAMTSTVDSVTRIVKVRPDGTVAWARTLPNSMNFQDIDVAADGTVAVAGNAGDALVVRYSAAGALSWVRRYRIDGDSIYGSAVAIRSDGRIFLGGSGSNRDFVVATEADGTLAWISDVDAAGVASSLIDMQLIGNDTLALLSQRNDVGFGQFFGYFTTVSAVTGAIGTTANINFANDEGGDLVMTTTATHAFVAARGFLDSNVNVTRYGPGGAFMYAVPNVLNLGGIAANGTNLYFAYRSSTPEWRMKGTTVAGAALWDVALDGTIRTVSDLEIDSAGRPHLLATEASAFGFNSYLARYLMTGVRSSVRRVSGTSSRLSIVNGVGMFVVGTNPVRAKGQGPIVTRYN